MNACRIINSSLIIMISNFFNKYNMFCVKFRTCCYRNMFKKCGSFTIWGHIDVVYPKNIQNSGIFVVERRTRYDNEFNNRVRQ